MLSELQFQILGKVAEVILQSRLEVKKALFKHFQAYLQKLKDNAKLSNMSISDFVNQLVQKDSYYIKQKVGIKHHNSIKINHNIQMQIVFYLNDKGSGNLLEVESWVLEVQRKKDITNSSLQMVIQFFKEVIFILNKLPLFSIYQKDKELKAKYVLDYKVFFQNIKTRTLIDLRAKDIIIKQNQSLRIKADVSFLPSFKSLINKQAIIEESKRRTSVAISQHEADKKVSVYSFYDPDLDFTFLASDDQDFSKKGNAESIQIHMQMEGVQISEQFELLIGNEEQEFMEENREILQLIIRQQRQYLNL